RAAGVHFATPPATSGPPTARSLILVTPDGERTMNTYLGAAACLEPEDVDPSVLTASRIAYLEGYLWDPPQAKEALRRTVAAGREVTAVAAHPVERVVDTTGAGDLYAAGFLFGLARGLGLERCARLGGLAAAEVISHFGARPWVSLSRLAAEAGLLGPEGGRA